MVTSSKCSVLMFFFRKVSQSDVAAVESARIVARTIVVVESARLVVPMVNVSERKVLVQRIPLLMLSPSPLQFTSS